MYKKKNLIIAVLIAVFFELIFSSCSRDVQQKYKVKKGVELFIVNNDGKRLILNDSDFPYMIITSDAEKPTMYLRFHFTVNGAEKFSKTIASAKDGDKILVVIDKKEEYPFVLKQTMAHNPSISGKYNNIKKIAEKLKE